MKLADARARAVALTQEYGTPYVVLVREHDRKILIRPCRDEPPPPGYTYHYDTAEVGDEPDKL